MLECYYWKVEKGKREHNMFSLWLVSALLWLIHSLIYFRDNSRWQQKGELFGRDNDW
jgi:hypothetical protein